MKEAGQAGYSNVPQTTEAERAIAVAMSDLASRIGDLRTISRELANRISPLLPGGSPFDRIEKAASAMAPNVTSPKAVRSAHCEQLDSRIYELRELTETLQGIVGNIEI